MLILQLVWLFLVFAAVTLWVSRMEPKRPWGWLWWIWLGVLAVASHLLAMVAVGIVVLFIVP
ncbi:hypothetical protein [Pseudomonas phage vB_Pae-PA152]|nr:hypothetical protein [Pseudomonas phage vB_Pae-PA152]